MLYLYIMEKNITYEQVVKLVECERPIKEHFMKTYPTADIKILGRYGHGLSEAAIKRLIKLGQDNDDRTLLELIINRIKVYNEIYDIKGFIPTSLYIRKGKIGDIRNS